MIRAIKASDLSPISWWLLALAMAILAGASSGWIAQLLVALSALGLVVIFREQAPWSQSLGFYLALATFVVLARVIFRIIFNIPNPEDFVVFRLPELSLDLGFGPNILLFGDIGLLAISSGATDGLRLAAIILSVGMASSLANPRRLLKSTPSALYEIASAFSIAINLAPQLISSIVRVRRARMLRGRSSRLGTFSSTIIPVLEDAIESSLSLAASMDARGFGRRGQIPPKRLNLARTSSLAAAMGIAIGGFLLLVGTNQLVALGVLGVSLAFGALSIRIYSSSRVRTRYKPENFGFSDYVVFSISIGLVLLAIYGRLS